VAKRIAALLSGVNQTFDLSARWHGQCAAENLGRKAVGGSGKVTHGDRHRAAIAEVEQTRALTRLRHGSDGRRHASRPGVCDRCPGVGSHVDEGGGSNRGIRKNLGGNST